MQTLVLGIGNLLWADEGFGVRCVEAFAERFELPEKVIALDGGTQGLYLLPWVQDADALLIFDAIDFGLEPRTLRILSGDEVPRFMGAKKMSLHQTGFQEVLACAALTGRLPPKLVLIGVQPEELEDYGGSLRAGVRARIPEALERAREILRDWGVELRERATASAVVSPSTIQTSAALSLPAYEQQRPSEGEACRTGDSRVLAGLTR